MNANGTQRGPGRFNRWTPIVLTLTVVLLGPLARGPRAQSGTPGQWTTLSYVMPINPVHLALMNNGKVLVVSGSGNVAAETNYRVAVWDPTGGSIATQTLAWDMFCNGMVTLPDGRVFVNGGNLQYDPFHGQLRSAAFDPNLGLFTDLENMAHGRWYPTVTLLGDGRVMTFSGLSETGGTNTAVELYTPGSGWSQEYPAGWTPPLYPRMHLLPNGSVFYSGSGRGSRIFNPSTGAWSSTIATTNYTGTRTYGTSVLLPLSPADGYRARVMIFGGGNPSTPTTEIIEPLAATPSWTYGPPMSQPRIEMNATILPNGKILAVGGSLNDEDTATASLNADLYDPGTNSFSSAGANVYPRLYHSGSLLLPDATVAFLGGNPVRGSYEGHIEIYSPAYLFNADGTRAVRPTISGLSTTTVDLGATFQVFTPDAASIGSVVLVRPGAPTHAFDMDQRLIRLNYTAGANALDVTAPPSGNIAPPGFYMLFLLNGAGVPSTASFVRSGRRLRTRRRQAQSRRRSATSRSPRDSPCPSREPAPIPTGRSAHTPGASLAAHRLRARWQALATLPTRRPARSSRRSRLPTTAGLPVPPRGARSPCQIFRSRLRRLRARLRRDRRPATPRRFPAAPASMTSFLWRSAGFRPARPHRLPLRPSPDPAHRR